MYESILKTATDNTDFVFNVETVPLATMYVFKERSGAGNAFDFTFMVAIGLALIPTVMISFILKEREES
jgi:ATP-binding cassette subfamily A (ABC1) protein 3